MGMTKTLGGDRLGSGQKLKVHLHGYERSTHDLGYLFRTTMSPGTLIPFINEIALPGDTFDINLDAQMNTHPAIGPLFGSFKWQLDVFLCPIRLYNAMLHNNALNIGRNMSQVKLPQIEFDATVVDLEDETLDLDNSQINPSSLPAYLGIRGIGMTTEAQERQFCALDILSYWDIVKNYYANKQEEIGAVIHTPGTEVQETITDPIKIVISTTFHDLNEVGTPGATTPPLDEGTNIVINYVGVTPNTSQVYMNLLDGRRLTVADLFIITNDTGNQLQGYFDFTRWGAIQLVSWNYQQATDITQGAPQVVTFPLENIDEMRNKILQHPGATVFVINDANLEPYKFLYEQPFGFPNILNTQEGLAVKTFQSDLFNNWISTEWIDGAGGITEVTSIDTSGGSFSLDTLNISKKVYNMLNRIAVSGGTYNDWQDAVYDHNRYTQAESPMYMGGLSKELVFQEVVSNSETGGTQGGTQPLGTLAGKGVLSKKHKGGHVVIKVDEPSVIMGIMSLTPRIDYSQGNKWHVNLKTMDDFHKPALDEIGFQELITEQMAWWDTHNVAGTWTQSSAGKQPAWINYMTNVNVTRGNFAVESNEMFMTLNRRYEADGLGKIDDLTTYIDPVKFNFIFANTAIDAQNFWAQVAVDITARRKMSAKVMPNV